MMRLCLFIGTFLLLFLPTDNDTKLNTNHETGYQLTGACSFRIISGSVSRSGNLITAMEALELVKEQYAYDFVKTETGQAGEYAYHLKDTGLYLTYEGEYDNGLKHLIHLYEFVVDDPETGIGHSYTYGWYAVDSKTGEITDMTN